MEGKEIVTLQFGHYSNFVGTHWWNLIEQSFEYNTTTPSDINHNVLYREGLTNKRQVTFTPRLLLVDLQGSLKCLPERGDLYESASTTSEENIEWEEGLVEVQKELEVNKTDFQYDLEKEQDPSKVLNKHYDFEKDVNVWSDFLYTRFHPRTVNVVKEYQHCNQNTPFDAFPCGTNLWKQQQFEEDFSDRIRNYIEECDNFQGFHILTDATNAFAGLSSSCLEYIRDEYERKAVLVFPILSPYYSENHRNSHEEKAQSLINDSVRVLNTAIGFNEFSKHSNLFVPLSTGQLGWRQPGPKRQFQYLNYDEKLPYHSSAILAAALDSLTLKYRLRSAYYSLVDLCSDLNQNGRNLAAASVRLPFPFKSGSDLLDVLDKWDGPLYQSITPRCSIGTDKLLQHITLRGISEDRLKQPLEKAKQQRELPAYRCDSIAEMLQMYLAYSSHATASNVTVVHKPLTIKNPFPQIFYKNVGQDGDICENSKSRDINVKSVPVLSGLHSGSEIGDMLESLHTEARRIKIARFHQFVSDGFHKDDFEECLDNLFVLRENYEDNYLI